MVAGRHFEVFGMDILLDDTFKCWLLECNNSPGLQDSTEKVNVPREGSQGGSKVRVNSGARQASKDTRAFLHDLFCLLNLDSYTKHGSAERFNRIL